MAAAGVEMEITVVESTNVPQRPVLAIHAGSVRRQVKLEANQPFSIPHPGSCTSMEVTIFQQLASQLLPAHGRHEVTCTIPVRISDKASTQVKLLVRRPEAANVKAEEEDAVGGTRDYLDHHQLQHRVQCLIQDVLRDQPVDPFRHMLQLLKQWKANGGELPKSHGEAAPDKASAAAPTAGQEAPLVPRPPDKPKPEKSGASRPVGGRTLVGASETAAPDEHRPWAHTGLSEAQLAAKESIHMVLNSPRCTKIGEQSLRQETCADAAVRMSNQILTKVTDRVCGQDDAAAASIRVQARQVVRMALVGGAWYLSSEYKHSSARWAIFMMMQAAVVHLGADAETKKACLVDRP